MDSFKVQHTRSHDKLAFKSNSYRGWGKNLMRVPRNTAVPICEAVRYLYILIVFFQL